MNGRLSSSGSVHSCVPRSGTPYVMHPRHSRDTFRPERPSFTYSIGSLFEIAAWPGPSGRVLGARLAAVHPSAARAALARPGWRTGIGR